MIIPYAHSTIVNYTSFSVLAATLYSYYVNHGLLTYSLACLYISTVLYWRFLHHSALMRHIDMFMALYNIAVISLYYSAWYCCGYRGVWVKSISFSGCIYIVNNYIFYRQTNQLDYDYQPALTNVDGRMVPVYQYFSLAYTFPDTYQRDQAYKWNTIVHSLALHILPAATWIYCVYNSNYYGAFIYYDGI